MWKQKYEVEELRALVDDDPTQTTLSSTMINLNRTLIEKRPEWAKRHGKVILLHNNAPSHTSKLAKDIAKLIIFLYLSLKPVYVWSVLSAGKCNNL